MDINLQNWRGAGSLLLIILLAFAEQAFACIAPRPIQYQKASQLIARTQHIVLAKVEYAQCVNEYDVSYRFTRVENLKGKNKANFQLLGITDDLQYDHSFNHHTDDEFWQQTGGRGYTSSDCQIYPSFTIGSTYLLFLDKPYHYKSFEKIDNSSVSNKSKNKDKWLSYVKHKILDE